MTIEANKAVMRRVYSLLDNGELDRVRDLMTDDCATYFEYGTEPMDRDTTIELIRAFYGAFPDYVHIIDDMIGEGDRVAVRLHFQATHRNEFQGIPATGKPVTGGAQQIARIVDGKVAEFWLQEDMLGLMQQLGLELKPKEADAGRSASV